MRICCLGWKMDVSTQNVIQITQRKNSNEKRGKCGKMPAEIGFLTGQTEKINKPGGERGK